MGVLKGLAREGEKGVSSKLSEVVLDKPREGVKLEFDMEAEFSGSDWKEIKKDCEKFEENNDFKFLSYLLSFKLAFSN